PAVAVLSEALWRRRYAADPGVISRTLRLDGGAFTMVGVMPSASAFPDTDVDLWLPLRPPAKERADRGGHWLRVIGRLRPGTTLAGAQAEMEGIAARIARAFPADQEGRSALVQPLRETVVDA